jgi:hypothetical protein
MEIARLVRLIAAGKVHATDLSMQSFAFKRVLKTELVKAMQAARDFGMAQVRNEIQRQGVRAK